MAETVLVTGASRGIGRATALELHERGWEVVATARDPRTIADLPVTARVALDVTDAAAVRSVAQEWPGVDAVVNNAGIGAAGPVESTPVEVAREIFEVNVHGVLRTVAAFAPAMRARGSGAFVTVSSVVARIATPLAGVYASSKWALEGLSEAMRVELSHFGVRVTLIEPGVVSTGAFEAFVPHFPADNGYGPLAAFAASRPPTASSTPNDVARAVADVLERSDPPLRVPVGEAATRLLGARAAMDDATFDSVVRSAFTPVGW